MRQLAVQCTTVFDQKPTTPTQMSGLSRKLSELLGDQAKP